MLEAHEAPTDEMLMAAHGRGDMAAYEELVRRYWTPVLGFLRRILQNEAAVDDALLETFFKLHRSAPSYEPRARFSTFLFSIAYREAVNQLRVQQRDGALRSALRAAGEDEKVPALTTAIQKDCESQVQARQDLIILDGVLESLPEVQRVIFLLYHREELRTDEIAAVLELPPGTVRTYLARARNRLWTALEAGTDGPGGG